MKKVEKFRLSAMVLVLLFCSLKAFALDYTITFTGSGASSTVENVIVQNLTKGTQVAVSVGNVLRLSDQTNAIEKTISELETLKILSTPEVGRYTLSFYAPNAGVTQISAYSIDGRKLAGINTTLQIGDNSFQLSLPQGLYVIRVAGSGYNYSEKLVNQVGLGVKPGITFTGGDNAENRISQKSKSVTSVFMSYTTGDMLLYKGISGNYSTIVTDVPTANKTINFNFVECKDASGNYYTVVKIGNQTWMAENLRTAKFRTGDDIVNLTNSSDWGMFTISSWCNYNNNPANDVYGKLYNWYAVSDSRNIAPLGWHVATDVEWTALTTTLGGESLAGGKLKETGSAHWNSPNTGATNSSGFSALPAGDRVGSTGVFETIGTGTFWWTATEQTSAYVYFRSSGYNGTGIGRSGSPKQSGLSVRCVKDADLPTLTTTAPTGITYTTAIGGGNITTDGGAAITARGVCWSTTANPTVSNSKSTSGTGTGTFTASIMGLTVNTTYYVRAYATNSSGTAYGEQLVFNSLPYDALTVVDADGNLYHTVTIGTQVWMVENLRTTKYRNGDPIPNITDNSSWVYLSGGAYCWFNNDIANKEIYGALYNGYTVFDSRNIAPFGWHVPALEEWTILSTYLGGDVLAGSKLKESGAARWYTPNVGATNESGFTALPGGARNKDTGAFTNLGLNCFFWNKTQVDSYSSKQSVLYYDRSNFGPSACSNNYGNSVRCIKNSVATILTTNPATITSTAATCGGNVTLDGGEFVTEYGICWSTSSNPTVANSKKAVGTGIGSFTTSITGLTPNITYYVRAYATNGLGTAYGQEVSFKTLLTDPITVTDIDGNVYHTVTIGTQTWMVENLKTTRYNDGAAITYLPNSYDWTAATSGGYCWPNGSIANKETYGAMYNWFAASTGKLAPTGWHVPAKSEAETLVAYLGGTTVAGSKLKESGNLHWVSGNTDATNSSGFTAVPGGYRSSATGNFQQFGVTEVWWITTEYSGISGYQLGLESSNAIAALNTNYKLIGCNVRCIKNTLPVASTNSVSSIMSTTVTVGGTIVNDGGEAVTDYGLCWSTSTNPTIANSKKSVGAGIGSFSTSISGLIPNTTYYVRAYATNALGTAYGEPMSFKTLLTDPITVTDIDGNVYHTVIIGSQTWMVENLKTTKYNDGTSIPLVTDSYQWTTIATPGYCWTNNDITNKDVYGAMYNFYTVNTGKLAPAGWHVPTESDWITLMSNLGGILVSGGELKESGMVHWVYANLGATNGSGFTALPGGYRSPTTGAFNNFQSRAVFWGGTEANGLGGRFIIEDTSTKIDYGYYSKSFGFSVRCIKD
ncbi:MAG: FISUMP domain-containing protein [Paludibacter sp.]